ncbi:protocatechuate 3,4-dioxygenase [uncultured Thiohalocapsa sp.]|uniref:protocatechuate 3,4-dioxygenase n=1 Tax=uncultured Thiohalocapsa sp. TaxID=768990 RepID=UPI0025D95B37|nr:protocatechuate 3,4-dioxygenase [uncultured Thiohalocapsa sp.]
MPHEPRQPRRRQLLFAAAGLTTGLAPALGLPAARTPTPVQSRGPFYPDRLPLDRDNDLTRRMPKGNAADGVARGEITDLAGRVLTTEGAPLEGALVEIWQCDANGRYLHTGDRGGAPRDPGFQGYGRTRTDSDGGYRFRTIKPVPYPGRAPHIHIAVTAADGRQFVTQVYVEGAPENPGDFLRRRLPPAERAAVTVPFHPAADAPGLLAAHFDIVLG